MKQAEHQSEPPGSIAPLRDFVVAMTRLIEQHLAESELLAQAKPLLATLIARDDWLPPALAEPHPQFYRQYLLHADPLERFSVVSFVWGPGQATPVHDHTVWGLIGMLRGEEVAQPHALDAQGVAHPHGPATRLRPGAIEAVSPTLGDVHRVSNAYDDRTSISIHVYGANIGAVQRWVYPPEGGRKPFVSGYSEPALPRVSSEAVREALRQRREIALIDVREEDPFAQEHPLFAAQLPLSRLELDAPWRLPRREVPLVVYDDGEGLAALAARRLQSLGYTQVSLLDGGLAGWRRSGGELFRDVNVPSKAFGELVEHQRGTPSLAAEDVKALLDRGEDVVVLDARRFDEYQTMSIPSGISVPGAELALRVRDLAPNPATRVIVNCAGRTRSIIGTQSLVNAGIPNPVSALRNGTIGWTLAGYALDRGQQRRFGPASTAAHTAAREAAQALATRAGAERLTPAALASLTADAGRTVYRYDVRTPEEYAAGHLPGFGSAPGGQLVQETDMFAPVRGARIVLADIDGVRAPMTAHWLAQLGWDVAWVDGAAPELFTDIEPLASCGGSAAGRYPDGWRAGGGPGSGPRRGARLHDQCQPCATPHPRRLVDAALTVVRSTGPRCRASPGAAAPGAHLRQQRPGPPRGGRCARAHRHTRAGAGRRQRGLVRGRLAGGKRRAATGQPAHRPLPAPLRGHRQPARGDAGLPRLGVRPGRATGPRRHTRLSRAGGRLTRAAASRTADAQHGRRSHPHQRQVMDHDLRAHGAPARSDEAVESAKAAHPHM